jgi:hypothetical protein
VADEGLQTIVVPPPPPEPTHSFTETAVEPGARPTKMFVTMMLQRSVEPPPLIELLH